jgi:pilus assembly protein CpaF
MLKILAASRVNMMITGGTGSGKTTLLNCLTRYISPLERIITCEDAAELQLQQKQVVSLETRPVSIEGVGLVTMRDLVRNCLRMRPDRIIVGEVRGAEAFDLLQAMNTGHDGSLGTYHANSPRDALFRLENMVSMANLGIPVQAIREQIASSLEVIVHTQRLRDGSRKVMNITEIAGMENGVIMIEDLITYEITGEDENGRVAGEFRCSHIFPRFREKIRHYNLERKFMELIQA